MKWRNFWHSRKGLCCQNLVKYLKKKKKKGFALLGGDFSACSDETFGTGLHNQVMDPEQGEGLAGLLQGAPIFQSLHESLDSALTTAFVGMKQQGESLNTGKNLLSGSI